jgi:UDP-2,3-diacylglucosamine hydrolase
LGFAGADVERAVNSFLRHVATHAGSLIVNGDLFEFWFEWRTVIPRGAFRTVAALGDVVDAGVQVMMIAGNHDCWGGDVLRRDIGVDYQFGPLIENVCGWRTHIEHGDGLRPREDRRYRMLRRILRNSLAIRSFRWLHPDLTTRLASGSSNASRNYAARDHGRGLRVAAERVAAADASIELVLLGHSHVPTLERLTRGAAYANAGSWLDAPTFLRITSDEIVLRRWEAGVHGEGSAESADLDVLHRAPKKALADA